MVLHHIPVSFLPIFANSIVIIATMSAILIIEDDVSFSQLLQKFLEKNGYDVTLAHNVKTGKQFLLSNNCDLLLLDYRLPDGSGIEVLSFLREHGLQVAPVIMTSFHDIRTAVKTVRSGAFDYITKPVNPDELLLVIQEALAKKELPSIPLTQPSFVKGTSASAKKLHEYIQLVAPTEFSVIIQGESGTGKELAARSIHNLSKRKNEAFVALDCGALSPDLAGSELFGYVKGAFTGAVQNKRGHFEEANGGTIFLDEVGNLSYEIQVKLLRVIQERVIQPVGSTKTMKIDVRVITATNDNLQQSVRNGKFREDLYHRLNEFTINIPSLQERKADLGLFIDFFIRETNAELGKRVKGIADEVNAIFLRYDWPGNLRELKNIIKRAVLLSPSDVITTESLPEEMLLSVAGDAPAAPTHDLRAAQALSEKDLIIKTLEQVRYNKSKAAKLLNIDRTTLYYKMSKYQIE